ncbi:hypothetical protein ANTRET_LOCUS3570 [Anthophora retusa]
MSSVVWRERGKAARRGGLLLPLLVPFLRAAQVTRLNSLSIGTSILFVEISNLSIRNLYSLDFTPTPTCLFHRPSSRFSVRVAPADRRTNTRTHTRTRSLVYVSLCTTGWIGSLVLAGFAAVTHRLPWLS